MITGKSFLGVMFWMLVVLLFIAGFVLFARDGFAASNCPASAMDGTWQVTYSMNGLTDQFGDPQACSFSCRVRVTAGGLVRKNGKCFVTFSGDRPPETHWTTGGTLEIRQDPYCRVLGIVDTSTIKGGPTDVTFTMNEWVTMDFKWNGGPVSIRRQFAGPFEASNGTIGMVIGHGMSDTTKAIP